MSEKPDNPWRESLLNCISGDNYLRSSEYHQLIDELDRLYTIEQAAALAHTGPTVDKDSLTAEAAPAGEVASAPDKLWCETCEGGGMLHQEHQAGCWVGGDFPCPDCDGKGYWTRATPAAAPGYVSDELLDPDMQEATLKLHMGEMSAQECRAARAAIRWANSRVLAAASTVQGKEKP